MASLREVGEGIDRVLDKAAEAGAALRTAAELAEDAQGLLMSAAEGSLQSDVETANAQLAEAVQGDWRTSSPSRCRSGCNSEDPAWA